MKEAQRMKQAFCKMFGAGKRINFNLPGLNCSKVLVVVPHPDDETLGCGATINSLVKKSCQVRLVLMTDGGGQRVKEGTAQIRLDEFRNATKILGCTNIRRLDFPDGKLGLCIPEAIEQLTEILEREQPQIIFTPYTLDYNTDHRYSNLILSRAVNSLKNLSIAMYEVWTPIIYPDYYLNVTHEFDTKKSAIDCYKSQEELYKLKEKSRAINDLRVKLIMRKNVKNIEAFKIFEKEDFIDIIRMLEYFNMF